MCLQLFFYSYLLGFLLLTSYSTILLGKRKYRRNQYDNTNHQGGGGSISKVRFAKDDSARSDDLQHADVSDQGDIEPKFDDENSDIDAKRGGEGDENGHHPSETPTQFTCRLCQEDFPQLRSLVKHMALSHFRHIWNAETTSSENGLEGSADPTENENPYAVSQTGPYECHTCYEYRTDSRDEYIVHLAWRHDVLKPMMGEYADYKLHGSNDYDGSVDAPVEDVEPELEGQDIDFDIDDEMEENDDLGDGDEVDGEDDFEEDTFQTVEQDDVTVDEMDGLNVGEIDVPSDVDGESEDEVQIQ